jgi:hypothetical protein
MSSLAKFVQIFSPRKTNPGAAERKRSHSIQAVINNNESLSKSDRLVVFAGKLCLVQGWKTFCASMVSTTGTLVPFARIIDVTIPRAARELLT